MSGLYHNPQSPIIDDNETDIIGPNEYNNDHVSDHAFVLTGLAPAGLTGARRLTASGLLSFTDAGAGSTVAIGLTQAAVQAAVGGLTGLAAPSTLIGLSAAAGVATTAMRSDAAPALSQAIAPTWTGIHTFTQNTFGTTFDASTGFRIGSTAPSGHYLRGNGSAYIDSAILAADLPIVPAALTRANDVNLTATLSGTPGTALLQSVLITLGWAGLLGLTRGGTNADLSLTGGAGQYVKQSSLGGPLTVGPILAGDIPAPTGQPLTRTNDANVSLTLGGTPATALLQAVSLTLAWVGLLGLNRGGTNADLSTTGGAGQYLKQTSLGGAVTVGPILAGDVPPPTGQALSRTNDTNVSLTLGGTPATALLQATSLTVGWLGLLGLTRGGTNADLSTTGGPNQYVKQSTVGGALTVGLIATGDLPAQALTRTNDTNVSLTLGGTPATSLLAAVSLTMGWVGLLGLSRGGTNADLSLTGGAGQYLKQVSAGAAITVGVIPASDIGTAQAMTSANDTNMTLTLGGTPATALLRAVSLTLAWAGLLGLNRGGTNADLSATGGAGRYLKQTSVGAAITVATIAAADVPGSALTKTDDTNVTLTLGGTPATALLNAASLTLGWAGLLGLARGGTNANLAATGGAGQYLKQTAVGAAVTVGTIPATDLTGGAALTRTNDTNVSLTLGGTPASALLAAVSLTVGWLGLLALNRGGTNADLSASGGPGQYLKQSTVGGAVTVGPILLADLPSGGGSVTFANPTATVGLTVVNGSSTNAMRADAAPALDQSITPVWTSLHYFARNMGGVYPTLGLGVAIGGNFSSGQGEIDFFNTNSTLVGGFYFYNQTAAAAATFLASINAPGVINLPTGYRIANAAPAGHYLRGNGTNYVDGTIAAADLPGAFAGFATPAALVGTVAIAGAAATAMRSDAAPAINAAMTPTWVGQHAFASGQIILNNATRNVINFGTSGVAPPGTASVGQKLILYNGGGASDFSMGIDNNTLWFNSGGIFNFYAANVSKMTLDAAGNAVIAGNITGQGNLNITANGSLNGTLNVGGQLYSSTNIYTAGPIQADSAAQTAFYAPNGCYYSAAAVGSAFYAPNGGMIAGGQIQANTFYTASGSGSSYYSPNGGIVVGTQCQCNTLYVVGSGSWAIYAPSANAYIGGVMQSGSVTTGAITGSSLSIGTGPLGTTMSILNNTLVGSLIQWDIGKDASNRLVFTWSNQTGHVTTTFGAASMVQAGVVTQPFVFWGDGSVSINDAGLTGVGGGGTGGGYGLQVYGGVRAGSYATKSGTAGGYDGHSFNIDWVGNVAHLWLDATNLGYITLNVPNTSDARVKRDFQPLTGSLAVIRQLNPLSYIRLGEAEREFGFTTRDIQPVLPNLVHNTGVITDETPDGLMRLDYNSLHALAIAAMQELDRRVTQLEGR